MGSWDWRNERSFAIASPERQLGAVDHVNGVLAEAERLHRVNFRRVHDCRAADSCKSKRGQTTLHGGESLADHAMTAGQMESHVVTSGLDP